jgi:hypothetical protein
MVRSRRVFILLSPGYFKDPMRMFESDRAEMEHFADIITVMTITTRTPTTGPNIIIKLSTLQCRLFSVTSFMISVSPSDEQEMLASIAPFDNDIQVRQWIKTIFMKKLEENGRKKYLFFCPQRDALAGEDYAHDLIEKMVRSRRVLFFF